MSASKSNDVAKHRVVRDAIADMIGSGKIKPDERLPAERALARTYGVSYMTARRAVTEMVEAGLLERRGREGTYVRAYGASRLSTTTLHIICPNFDNPDLKTLLQLCIRECVLRGWKYHMIRLSPSNERVAIRAIQEEGLALVLAINAELQGPLGEAMQKAQGRAVLVGNRLDSLRVPSVLADDAQAVRLAMRRFHEAGHTKIAFITDNPGREIDRVRIATWRGGLGAAQNNSNDDLIVIDTPPHEDQISATFESVKAYFEKGGQATAFITLGDEMAVATLAACRAVGKSVPDEVSLINSGNTPLASVAYPAITCIDVHLDAHIERAMQFLDNALNGNLSAIDRLRLIEPHLIERDSVKSLVV